MGTTNNRGYYNVIPGPRPSVAAHMFDIPTQTTNLATEPPKLSVMSRGGHTLRLPIRMPGKRRAESRWRRWTMMPG